MTERRNATETYVQSQLGLYVPKSLYDANTVLAATTDDTPAAITMGASTILARLVAGNIKAASVAEIAALLAPALPGYEVGYDQITSPVTVASTTEASGTTVISCAAHTFDGSPVIAVFSTPSLQLDAGAAFMVVSLFEGSTQKGVMAVILATVNSQNTATYEYRFTPSAGSHTYTVTAYKGSAGGTAVVRAGSGGTSGILPASIRFTKATV